MISAPRKAPMTVAKLTTGQASRKVFSASRDRKDCRRIVCATMQPSVRPKIAQATRLRTSTSPGPRNLDRRHVGLHPGATTGSGTERDGAAHGVDPVAHVGQAGTGRDQRRVESCAVVVNGEYQPL